MKKSQENRIYKYFPDQTNELLAQYQHHLCVSMVVWKAMQDVCQLQVLAWQGWGSKIVQKVATVSYIATGYLCVSNKLSGKTSQIQLGEASR